MGVERSAGILIGVLFWLWFGETEKNKHFTYLSSSNHRLMHHFSYTKLHCLTADACPTVYCRTAVVATTPDFQNFTKVAPTINSQNFIFLCCDIVYCGGWKVKHQKYLTAVFIIQGACGMWAWLRLSCTASVTYLGLCAFRSWMTSIKLCASLLYCTCVRDVGSGTYIILNYNKDIQITVQTRCSNSGNACYYSVQNL